MGRPKKVLVSKPNASMHMEEEESGNASGNNLMVQSRSRRMIKPNPKYNSKEIIPLKRLELDDEEEEEEVGDNSEDDEDFQDDGGRDSEPDGSPGTRRRGRPRLTEAPRSEPPPMRKLQQIRAGYKEGVAMSTSKLLQQSGVTLEKKRKIDFDNDEDSGTPMSKRRQGVVPTANVVVGRTTMTRLAASVGEKENAAVKKNSNDSFAVINVEKLKTPTPSAGVTTRRTLTRDSGGNATATPNQATATNNNKATPSPVALALRTASNAAANTATKDSGGKSMIQVRRTTPMTQTTGTANKVVVATNRPAFVQQTKATNAVASPAIVRTSIRTGGTPVAPRIVRTQTTPVTSSTATTNATTPVARSAVSAAAKSSPASNLTSSTIKTPGGTTIPAGAEVERLADGKTTRITSYEKRFVVRMPPEQSPFTGTAPIMDPFICLAQLRTDIKQVKLPPRWTYQVKLMRVTKKTKDQATVTVQRSANDGEFEVLAIEMNRVAEQQPGGAMVNGQKKDVKHDRTVTLKQKKINVMIDGQAVRLIGAPDQLATTADVETLVQIVDSLTWDSVGVVEVLDGPIVIQ